MVDVSSLWLPSNDSGLTQLVSTLIKSGGVTDEVLSLIDPLCLIKSEFCEQVFPLVIHDILRSNDNYRDVLSKQVNSLVCFLKFLLNLFQFCQFFSKVKTDSTVPIHFVHILIDTIMYLRTVPRNNKKWYFNNITFRCY